MELRIFLEFSRQSESNQAAMKTTINKDESFGNHFFLTQTLKSLREHPHFAPDLTFPMGWQSDLPGRVMQ